MTNLIKVPRATALSELVRAVNTDELADGEGALLLREGNMWTLVKKGIPVNINKRTEESPKAASKI